MQVPLPSSPLREILELTVYAARGCGTGSRLLGGGLGIGEPFSCCIKFFQSGHGHDMMLGSSFLSYSLRERIPCAQNAAPDLISSFRCFWRVSFVWSPSLAPLCNKRQLQLTRYTYWPLIDLDLVIGIFPFRCHPIRASFQSRFLAPLPKSSQNSLDLLSCTISE
jgi:hypothetical protein